MKSECSFYLPKKLRKKLGKLTFPELQEIAIRAGNQAAFRALDQEREDFEQIAKRVGAEQAFRDYESLLESYRSQKSSRESSELTGLFYLFLLAKICFPAEWPASVDLRLPPKPLS